MNKPRDEVLFALNGCLVYLFIVDKRIIETTIIVYDDPLAPIDSDNWKKFEGRLNRFEKSSMRDIQ